MNPIRRYRENKLITQVLIQTLVLAINENTVSMKILSQQLAAITEKKPVNQEDLDIRDSGVN